MGFKISVLVLSMFAARFASAASGADVSLCDSLAAYTCSDGLHADGTGAVQKVRPETISNEAMVQKHRALIEAAIANLVKTSSANAFSSLCKPSSDPCQVQVPKSIFAAVATALDAKPSLAASSGAPVVPEDFLGSKKFTRLIQDIRAQISLRETDAQKLKLLERQVFPELKKDLLKKIATLPLTPDVRQKIVARIGKITLDKQHQCDAGFKPMLFMPTAHYTAKTNSIRVCDGMLGKNFSEFKLAQSMAHELTHSFDPCNVSDIMPAILTYSTETDLAQRDSEYLWPELVQCLRGEASIKATAWTADPEVSSSVPYYDYCQNDQITESVADWMSAELLTAYIQRHYPRLTRQQWYEGYSNIFRFYCYEKYGEKDPHPAIADRVSRLLVVNPAVREKLGCAAPVGLNYCQIKGTVSRAPSSRHK